MMLSQEMLRKLGVLGVAVGLLASPLAFADMHEEPQDPAASTQPAEDPAASQGQDPMADPGAPGGDDPMADPAGQGGQDAMNDPAGAPEPGTPADEPGFGSGTEPMPSGDSQAEPQGEEDWETPAEDDQEGAW